MNVTLLISLPACLTTWLCVVFADTGSRTRRQKSPGIHGRNHSTPSRSNM